MQGFARHRQHLGALGGQVEQHEIGFVGLQFGDAFPRSDNEERVTDAQRFGQVSLPNGILAMAESDDSQPVAVAEIRLKHGLSDER